MTRSELIATVATRHNLSVAEAKVVVDTVFGEIKNALTRDVRVELRGFGSFGTKIHPARMGRNPKTGKEVQVVEKRTPFFKAGKELRVRVDG